MRGKLSELASAIRRRLGRRWLLVLGGLVVVAVTAVIVVVASGGDENEVTASEFEPVKPGMAQDSVRDLLGDPDRLGSHEFQVSQQTSTPVPAFPGGAPLPAAPTTTQTTVQESDCWFYPVGGETGGQVQFGPGDTFQLSFSPEGGDQEQLDEAVICFDEGQRVSIASGPAGLSE